MTAGGGAGNASEARPEWVQQDEGGSASMLRLMTWVSLRLGRRVARCVLPSIAAYFLLRASPARRASRLYLRRVLGHEPRWRELYRHVHCFASTIHDRIYLINNRFELFDIEVLGRELITDQLATGRGAFLMGAHLGSFEVMRALAREQLGLDVAMVMYEENARKVNAALAAVNPAARLDIIPLGCAGSMLQVRRRLLDGSVVGILGDRTLGGDVTVPVSFLNEPASVSAGPFRMAAMLRQPLIFMTGLYLGGNRYRIHFEPLADFSMTTAEEREAAERNAIERYVALLERYCRAVPYNWFNFFDFWQPSPDSRATRKARR